MLPKTFAATPEWISTQNPKQWLTEEELATFAGWNSEKRKAEWLAGRLAAKKLLRDEHGLAPLSWQIGREGAAPALTDCTLPATALSLSHSDGFGAATISNKNAEGSAGIDIQHIRPVHPGLCARVFSRNERQQIAGQFGFEDSPDGMLLLWALKEAAIKARRQPWGRSLQSISVQLGSANFAAIQMENEPLMTAQYERLGGWWLARVVKPPRPNSGEPD